VHRVRVTLQSALGVETSAADLSGFCIIWLNMISSFKLGVFSHTSVLFLFTY
jgi:hypothetical protein